MGLVLAVYRNPVNAERAVEGLQAGNFKSGDISSFEATSVAPLQTNNILRRFQWALNFLSEPVTGWFPNYKMTRLRKQMKKDQVLISVRYANLDMKHVAKNILESTGAEAITSATDLITNRSA